MHFASKNLIVIKIIFIKRGVHDKVFKKRIINCFKLPFAVGPGHACAFLPGGELDERTIMDKRPCFGGSLLPVD